ncbi:MAG: HD domain-containing protein [Oscillospiraceae bacterium]|nr:HD domain-containing protein [Oscillospiraceae bacterium]
MEFNVMEYIVTFTGERFTPLSPQIDKIHIEDIAHSLSLMCRANGHIDYFFSVAQHSLNCAAEAKARGFTARVQLACLIHDASEAYISDILTPVKQYLHEYMNIEENLQNTIYKKFLGEVPSEAELSLVAQIDNDMLINEFDSLMKKTKVFDAIRKLESNPSYECRNQKEVENEFLKTYYGIMHAGIIQGKFMD